MIKCKSCGADFDEHEPYCPFCGDLNYTGAEENFIHNLHDLKDEMGEMADDSEEEYKSGMKKGVVIAISIASVVILLIGILLAALLMFKKHSDEKAFENQRAMMIWKENNYDQLDAMYEDNQYDELIKFLDSHLADKGYNPYEWAHYDFIMTYQKYLNFLDDTAKFDTNNLTYMTWSLYDALYLDCVDTLDYMQFSDAELEIIATWQEEAHVFFTDTMGLNEAEIMQLKEDMRYSDYSTMPDSGKCRKYIKKTYNL